MVLPEMSNAWSHGILKRTKSLAIFSFAVALTGCSTMSDLDVLGVFEEDPPVAATEGQADARSRGDAETAASDSQATPNLSSVPPRPAPPSTADARKNAVEGLTADRENARYSDEVIRLQGETRASADTARAAPTTVAPPPPQITAPASRPTAAPTQVATVPPVSVVPPPPLPEPVVPVPVAAGPRPSVEVDTSAIDGSPGLARGGSALAAEEQVATIHFGHSSSRLDERDRRVLAEVASAQREQDAEVIVVGHASGRTQQLDKTEHELANFRISLARANRVAEQLIAMGVASQKVKVEAVASGSPAYSEEMPTGEAGNRRAEIYFRQ